MSAPERVDYAEIPVSDPGLTVGVIPVPGPKFRVGMMLDGRLMLMSPAAARRMAKDFDTDEARSNDLGWVAEALRESADNCEARCATKN